MAERIVWIDVAKGVAMLAIVFGHTVDMGLWKIWVYSFHVPLFFILSGMTFRARGGFRQYCASKAKRVLVPYFCFGFASILVFGIAGQYAASVLGREDIDTAIALNAVGLVYGNGKNGMMDFNLPLWFLPCIFVVYLMAYLVSQLEAKYARSEGKVQIAVGALAIAASFCMTLLCPIPALPFSIENAIVLFPFFYLGTRMGRVDWTAFPSSKRLLVGVLMFAFGSMAAALNAQYGIVDYVATACRLYPLFLAAALLQSCGLVVLLSACGSSSCVAYIGRRTMPILVMHKFPVVLIQIVLSGVTLSGSHILANPLVALLSSMVAIALCLLVNCVLARWVPWVFGEGRKRESLQR